MRTLLALIAVMLFVAPAAAQDRELSVTLFGGLTIAPQLCDLAIDPAALDVMIVAASPADDPEFRGDIAAANNELARAASGWSEAEHATFCEQSKTLAGLFDLLVD